MCRILPDGQREFFAYYQTTYLGVKRLQGHAEVASCNYTSEPTRPHGR